MRKKLPCLLLAGALALGLAACDAAAPDQTPTQPAETDAPAQPIGSAPPSVALGLPDQPPDPPTAEYGLPDRDYRPWQTAYMGFLATLRAEEWANETAWSAVSEEEKRQVEYPEELAELWISIADSSTGYSLCDVDKDGVPELFVQFGNCEAAYHTKCYTFREGEMAQVGEFGSGHSSLYTYPDKNAALIHHGQMGYADLSEFSLADGQLTPEVELFREGRVDSYTDPAEIVPGAERADFHYTRMGRVSFAPIEHMAPASGVPLLLPIADWYEGPAATGSDPEQARAAILAALRGETPLCGVSGDGGFYGATGPTTWVEYVQPGGFYGGGMGPFEIASHVWLDMNGDGQEECVLQLKEVRDDDAVEDCDYVTYYQVALSEQDGQVYAYYCGDCYRDSQNYSLSVLGTDGVIYNVNGDCDQAMSFYKGQCYQYAPHPDVPAQPVEWLDGPPAG